MPLLPYVAMGPAADPRSAGGDVVVGRVTRPNGSGRRRAFDRDRCKASRCPAIKTLDAASWLSGTWALRALRDHTLDLGKWAKRQPGFECGLKRLAAGDRQAAIVPGCGNGGKPHPDLGHGAQIRREIQIDVEARIDGAQIDTVFGIDDQPPIAPLRRLIGEDELNGAALPRHWPGVDVIHEVASGEWGIGGKGMTAAGVKSLHRAG